MDRSEAIILFTNNSLSFMNDSCRRKFEPIAYVKWLLRLRVLSADDAVNFECIED